MGEEEIGADMVLQMIELSFSRQHFDAPTSNYPRSRAQFVLVHVIITLMKRKTAPYIRADFLTLYVL